MNPLRASGLLDSIGLERARAHVRESGGLLSDALLRLGLVKEGDFLRIFAELYSTRFVKAEKLKGIRLDEGLLERVGVRSAERLRMCPIHWDQVKMELHVVASVPLSSSLEPELRQIVGAKSIVVYVATSGAVSALIRRAYYRQDDAFKDVTANGAGPALPPAARPGETFEEEARENTVERTSTGANIEVDAELGASSVDEQPEPQSTEGKTVMVNLEALTIATLRRENARYRIAQEFHRRVSLERSVEAMVDRILSVVFELLNADGAAVWLTSGRYASKSRAGDHVVEVPRTIIDQALVSTNGLLTNNALLDERFDRSKSVMIRGIKSVMAVPLRTRSGTIGILYVESVSMSAAFTDEDLPLLDSIASQASIMLDNAALVAQVQKEVETRASLSRFLSAAAVEEVLSGRMKVNMAGQNAEVTVLFADIRGFTTMSGQMPPEEVVRFLNAFFSEAVDAVEKNGGVVDKFIGDCVMAMWGAVDQREDGARKAIAAALEMVQRAGRITVKGVPLEMGVGINTGPAVVGAIGAARRLDYTAIGATVNLAARLCGIAQTGQVLVTSDTLLRAGPGVIHEPNEAVILKGIDVPIVPYSIKALTMPLQLNQVMSPHPPGSTFSKLPTAPGMPSPLKPR
ncbi:MAG: adenylate/guanylate cyclase domain-containing protein [Archangium sp.]|nr:adenylate/guanylate cyclase domain-containing protein [Archangium sp.]